MRLTRSILTREKLEHILSKIDAASGQITMRRLLRYGWIFRHQVEQAAEMGWVWIYKRYPRVGRPSVIVERVSKSCQTKLPPSRNDIEKAIDTRHSDFAFRIALKSCRGGSKLSRMLPYVDAYLSVYRYARSRRGAAASASRLLREYHVRLMVTFYNMQFRGELPRNIPMPRYVSEIIEVIRFYRQAAKAIEARHSDLSHHIHPALPRISTSQTPST